MRERFLFHTHVRTKIHLRCLHGFVPQPERDHGAINTVLQEIHGCGVTTHVRGNSLPLERGTGRCGKMGVLGDETLDRIAAESATTDTRKDRIFGQTWCSRSHASSIFAVSGRSRVQRCFLPSPRHLTYAPTPTTPS